MERTVWDFLSSRSAILVTDYSLNGFRVNLFVSHGDIKHISDGEHVVNINQKEFVGKEKTVLTW